MKLILSGGGSKEETKEQDSLFASMLDKSKPLLFIPLARNPKKRKYSFYFNYMKDIFDKLGITNYLILTKKNYKSISKLKPSFFSGVYIGGGNTPRLLKILKDTQLWQFLKKLIQQKIPIFGGSAGAIIFAKSITPAIYYDKNEVRLKNFVGMDLLNGWELTCHYKNNDERKLKNIMLKNKLKKLVALSDKNGLYIDNKKIILIGQQPAWVFNSMGHKRMLKVGDKLV